MTEQLDGQIMLAEIAAQEDEQADAEYEAFVEKFKPKKTTDDCYTPPQVMDAVNGWVTREFGRDPSKFVRPFYPGSDYQAFEYPDGCTVVDNPPFSILSQIEAYYIERGIQFFLFAPTLTCMTGLRVRMDTMTVLLCGVKVTYENGANVNTSFVTNLAPDYVVRTCPELHELVQSAADDYAKALTKTLPKYVYPYEVLYGADYTLAKHGQDYRVRRGEAQFIRGLDSQGGRSLFGSGLLVSERAAAERAAAERAAAERAAAERARAQVWELSHREREIVKSLDPTGPGTTA